MSRILSEYLVVGLILATLYGLASLEVKSIYSVDSAQEKVPYSIRW